MIRIICLILVCSVCGSLRAQEGTVLVANMSDNTVTILDAAAQRTVATVESGPAPHEISVSPSGEWAAVTNYGNQQTIGSSITMIHVPSARVTARHDLGVYERPHGVFFLPGDSLIVVTSERMQSLVFVDSRSGEIVDTLSTTQRASHMLASTPDGEVIFTTNIVDGTITEFDGASRTRGRVLPVADYVEGIGISPDGSRVWVGSNAEKTVSVVDVASGQVEAVFADFGFPYRMAVAPNGKVALLCDPGRSEIRFIHAESFDLLKTMTIPSTGAVASAEFPDSAAPEGLVITPDSKWAFVSLQARNEVAAIDLTTMEIAWTAATGVWPDGIGYSPLSASGDN